MKELAKSLPEYATVRSMGGVGDSLAPRLIAEIGNVKRLRNGHALVALAGIDPPPMSPDNLWVLIGEFQKEGHPFCAR